MIETLAITDITNVEHIKCPVNLAFYLEDPTIIQGYNEFVINHFEKIIEVFNEGTVLSYLGKLRDFVVKITASGVPVQKLAKALFAKYNGIIETLATMEYNCNINNKNMFVIEKSLDECVRKIANAGDVSGSSKNETMTRNIGVEPMTPRLTAVCSNQLS